MNADATLVELFEEAQRPRALVRVSLLADSTDAQITVSELRRQARGETLTSLATIPLPRGMRRFVLVETALEAGAENHLFYRVTARGRDGSVAETTAYLRVNLDETLEPSSEGDYVEYRGAAMEEVAR